MELKKEIEELLESLKKAGKERDDIEKELEYSENYIDQTLSKGGNQKFLGVLKRYANTVLQKAIFAPPANHANKDNAPYDLKAKAPDGRVFYIEAKELTASYERILEEKEARRLEAKERAERAEKENDRLLSIIEKNLTALLTNSNVTLERISLVETIVRSDDTVIMNNQDRLSGNEVGKSSTEAGNLQLAADKLRKGKGSQSGVRKQHIPPQ